MATQLTLVNNVLRRLREDEVTSVADNAYSQLIAMWVQDGIDDVTTSYDWSSLQHDITVAIVAGTSEYDLSLSVTNTGDVPDAERVTNNESLLLFSNGRPVAFLYDDSSDTDANVQLSYIMEADRARINSWDNDQDNEDPARFSLRQTDTGDGYKLTLWPAPSLNRELRIKFQTPQLDLAIDGTDDATEVIVPNKIVEAYAHMVAANERGEEIGEPGNLLERRFINRLGSAIEAAMASDIRANRYESVRD